jgi:hypothetical protein
MAPEHGKLAAVALTVTTAAVGAFLGALASGDEATAVVYLPLAGVMAWVGLFTDWSFGRR